MSFIEILESRIAPAILIPVVSKGTLSVAHDSGSATTENLVFTQTGPDSFSLTDTLSMTNFGPYTGVKNITLKLGEVNPTAEFHFSTDGLLGNLEINTGDGSAEVSLGTASGTGKIAGKVKIVGGNSADTLFIHDGLAIAGAVVFDGRNGLDTFDASDAYLAKKLTLESVENITIQNIEPVVIGGLLVENEDADANVVFVLSNVTTINGPLTYCGSDSVLDTVTLNGQVTGATKLMLFAGKNEVFAAGQFSSSVKITGKGGQDTIEFNSVSLNLVDDTKGPFITANLGSSLSINLGDGDNAVSFNDGSFFAKGFSISGGKDADTINFNHFNAQKNAVLNLGSGANSLNGNASFGSTPYVAGTIDYKGGNDADNVNLDGIVANTMSINLGSGTNSVDGIARIIGKSASITGGNGADTIAISLTSTAGKLTTKLSGGDDSFTFDGGALSSVVIDGGKGTDTLTGLSNLPVKRKTVGFEVTT